MAAAYNRPMFEAAEIGRTVDKAEYERAVAPLREELLAAQAALREADFPVLIIVGGVDGAGKGETINTLLEWIDPRYVETFALGPASDEERERPPFWRFWRALPPRGKIGVFFGGWHSGPIVDRAYKRIGDDEFERRLGQVVAFERLLVEDGAVIIKLWMHLSRDRQKKRLRTLSKDPATAWRVTDADWEHFAMYERFRRVSSQALRRTSVGAAPWTVVEATCRRYQTLTVGQLVRDRIVAQLAARRAAASSGLAPASSDPVAPAEPRPAPATVTILSRLDLSARVAEDDYRERLGLAQGTLSALARRAARKGRSTVVVYEGVDAAGKGGNIRRVTEALDARMYRVVPVAAPSGDERRYPYLWRFWRHLPRDGRLTLFDRSWYGRVLVERVEGFCAEADWMRAYGEINDFEEQLVAHGTIVVKLWLHIDQEEQLRRFREREEIGFKRWKITAEDWRNRDRWSRYELAVNDMVERTSTEVAPWTLIAANCKRHARLTSLATITTALEDAL